MAMLGDDKYAAARRARTPDFSGAATQDYNATMAGNAQAKALRDGKLVSTYNTGTSLAEVSPITDAVKAGYNAITGGTSAGAGTAAAGATGATGAAATGATGAAATGAAATGAAATGAATGAAATGAAATGAGAGITAALASNPVGWLAAAGLALNELL